MYSLYKGRGGGGGVRGSCPGKFWKSHLPHFLGLFFIYFFFINQFSLFVSAIL